MTQGERSATFAPIPSGEALLGGALGHERLLPSKGWMLFEEAERELLASRGLNAKIHVLDLPSLTLRVRVLESGEGKPLLLLPGGGVPVAAFVPIMALVAGRRILALDRPGWGPSEGFSYPRKGLRRFASELLTQVVKALDVPAVTVVGSSIGGTWALWFAADVPARTTAVVCLGCPAFLLGTGIPGWLRGQALVDWWPASQLAKDDHAIDAKLATLLSCVARAPGFLASRRDLIRSTLEMLEGDPQLALGKRVLRQVTQPVRFCWGDREPYASASLGRKACAVMKRASFSIVPGGHHPWLDSPEGCTRAIEQLDECVLMR